MADNKTLPPTGTGTADIIVATDEIAGVDYQKIKLVDGTADSTTVAKVTSEGNLQTITPNRTATGTLDANDEAVTVDCDGMGTVVWQVASSDLDSSAILNTEITLDGGTTWSNSYAWVDDSPPLYSPNATIVAAQSIVVLDTRAADSARVRLSNRTSGAITLTGQARPFAHTPAFFAGMPISGEVSVTGVSTAANQTTEIGHLATIAGDTTDIEAAVELIDDTVATLGTSTYAEATTKGLIVGAVRRDADTAAVGTDNEVAPLVVDAAGKLKVEAFDGGDSFTVDQATGTNLHTVLDSGTLTTLSTLTTITNPVTVAGGAAHASPVSGNPNLIAGRASTAVPTDVGADADAASVWVNRNGAPVVSQAPHVGLIGSPWDLIHEGAQYTSAQTSQVFVAGGASEKLVVTQMQIQAFSTTSGTVIVYFGTGAFSRGTNRTIFDGEFKPSSTLAPGAILTGPFISGANGDDILVTTVGDIDITISCWYYVVT